MEILARRVMNGQWVCPLASPHGFFEQRTQPASAIRLIIGSDKNQLGHN